MKTKDILTRSLLCAMLLNALATNTLCGAGSPGAVDPSFVPGLGSDAAINALAVQPDGGILIGGVFTTFDGAPRRRVARLLADGALDTSFMDPAVDAELLAMALQSDGRLLIVGDFTNVGGLTRRGVARLNTNGAVDSSFNPGLGDTNLWRALALQPDGKILLGGNVPSAGPATPRLVRLNTNGISDAGFAEPVFAAGFTWGLENLALQPDGKILLGGTFGIVNGASRPRMARLNADGSLDATFVVSPVAALPVPLRSLALLPDGNVLVGSRGYEASFVMRETIVRLLPNGLLDQSFATAVDMYATAGNPYIFPDPTNHAVVVQSDGKILLAGEFGAVNGETNRHFARLLPDGRRDVHFNTFGGPDGAVLATAPLPDGRVLIAGRFSGVDGAPSRGIARLLGDDGLPRIAAQPANATGTVGFPATFSVTTTNGRPPLHYQWFINDTTALPTGTNATLTLGSAQPTNVGTYRVVVSNALGAVTSAVATLTVSAGPRLVSAASLDGASIGLCFNVPVTTNSATNVLNYSVTGAGPVTNATLRADGRTVSLRLQTPVLGSFMVAASGIADTGPGNLGGGTVTGRVAGLVASNIGSVFVAGSAYSCRDGEFEVVAGGNDVWGGSDDCHFLSAPHSGDFDVKTRAHHLIRNSGATKAGLMVRESLNPNSATMWMAVEPPPPYWNVYGLGLRPGTGSSTFTWGLPGVIFGQGFIHANAPDSWMRFKRVGNRFQGFSSADGLDWQLFAQTDQPFSNTVHLGLFLGGFGNVTNGVARFSDYARDYRDLAAALDTAGLRWTTTGGQPWFGQAAVSHDGNAALQSGAITHGQTSSVATTVLGPGTLSFWWKVSSEAGADRLTFARNGTDSPEVFGEVDWEQRTVHIPAGLYTLTWRFDSAPGTGYSVLVSTNLSDWNPLGPATELAPGHFEFTDTDAPGHPTRFYRLRTP